MHRLGDRVQADTPEGGPSGAGALSHVRPGFPSHLLCPPPSWEAFKCSLEYSWVTSQNTDMHARGCLGGVPPSWHRGRRLAGLPAAPQPRHGDCHLSREHVCQGDMAGLQGVANAAPVRQPWAQGDARDSSWRSSSRTPAQMERPHQGWPWSEGPAPPSPHSCLSGRQAVHLPTVPIGRGKVSEHS